MPSVAYQDSLKVFKAQIAKQWKRKPLAHPIYLEIEVFDHNEGWHQRYFKEGKKPVAPRGSDLDNRVSSILDILTDSGVILDDVLVLETYAKKYPGERVDGQFGAKVKVFKA